MNTPSSEARGTISSIYKSQSLPEGFVYLDQIDPSIQVDLRYAGTNNFVGRSLPGYKKHRLITTKEAAIALKKAQELFRKDGYELLIYDAYRPQETVDYFISWAKDQKDQNQKEHFYPRVNKADVFELGYIASRSGHSRGSTVDLTLIPLGKKVLSKPIVEKRVYGKEGLELTFLNDETVDMGSHFDLFDELSHTDNPLIFENAKKMRQYLKQGMEAAGFSNYEKEWWHFTLKNEPFPDTYFLFPID